MANHSVPNLYRLRIDYVQKICGFSFETKPLTALTERLSYPKTTLRHFDRLDCCLSLDITFDIVSLILRKDNHLRDRFFGYGLNAKRFNSNAGFICGCWKIGINCRPYATDRIDFCRSRY